VRKESLPTCIRGVMTMDEDMRERFDDIELSMMMGDEFEPRPVGRRVIVSFCLFLTVLSLIEAYCTFA